MQYKIEEKLEAFVRSLNQFKTTEVISNLNISYAECKNPNLDNAKKLKSYKEFKQPRLIYKSDTYY